MSDSPRTPEQIATLIADYEYLAKNTPTDTIYGERQARSFRITAQTLRELSQDARRLEFLENCTMGPVSRGRGFSARRDYEGQTDLPTHGYLPTVTLFTVPSQHVKGLGIRAAIDAAILAADSHE